MAYRIAIDNGGTFTDGVCVDDHGNMVTSKAATTPEDLSIGTLNVIDNLAKLLRMDRKKLLNQTTAIVNGTTAGTNAIITRSGARLGIIGTKGFPDVIELRRAPKVGMFDWRVPFPEPLVPPKLRTEVEERVDSKGNITIPLNEKSARKAVAYLKKQKVEGIVVALLFSFLRPEHEQRVGEIIKEDFPEAFVSLSSTVLPAIGEFERTSTAVVDAYIAPILKRYINSLHKLLKKESFKGELLFMQNNGGTGTWEIALESPATLATSGPAAGPAAAITIGKLYNENNLLSVDMGGTSFDVLIIDKGEYLTKTETFIAETRFSLPVIDVNSIGAGGGSIAWFDVANTLHVGPGSAGSVPGPACYNRGGKEATVTDADVILGYISPDYFLGGAMKLRKDLAQKAIKEKVADRLGSSVVEAAAAIYRIINNRMADGISQTFTRRGYDPRDFNICAAGGAAPVHVLKIGQELGIAKALVAKVAPVYCAFGMTNADFKHDFTRFYFTNMDTMNFTRLKKLYDEMEAEGLDTLNRESVPKAQQELIRYMEVRYHGQYRQLSVPWPSGPINKKAIQAGAANFHAKHKEIFGWSDENYPIEFLAWKITAVGKVLRPKYQKIGRGGSDPSAALKGKRDAYFEEKKAFVKTAVYNGDKLLAGNILEGPCIVEERLTTLVIPPTFKMKVGEYGDYVTV